MLEKGNRANTLHGILLIALFSFAAFYIAEIPVVRRLSFSPLIVGIVLGMLYANSLRNRLPETWVPGIRFCTKQVLRWGIVLYGFRLTLAQVAAVGVPAVVVDLIVVTVTILGGVLLGRLLKIDRDTALMTSTGSAICGAAAVLGAEPGAAALAAAQEVAHVLVAYNGQVCFTPYFASASTGTASAAEVWGNDRAWLQAVDSPYDQSVSSHWNTNGNSSGTARFSRQTLQDRIRDVMDIDLSGVDPNSWFTIQSANQYGWVAKIQVGPDAGVGTVSGRWFRENLLARQSVDGRSLRSQCFTVSYNADLDCFIFDVYGYGHGCGMSQWGAIGYARNGWGYQDILTHYFVGTTITTY